MNNNTEYKIDVLRSLGFPEKFIEMISSLEGDSKWLIQDEEDNAAEGFEFHFPFYTYEKFVLSVHRIEVTDKKDFPEVFKEETIYTFEDFGFSNYQEFYDKLTELEIFLEICGDCYD